MTTAIKFEAMLERLSNAEIVDLIYTTWDEEHGAIIREFGFDILTDRMGEKRADDIYAAIWHEREDR